MGRSSDLDPQARETCTWELLRKLDTSSLGYVYMSINKRLIDNERLDSRTIGRVETAA